MARPLLFDAQLILDQLNNNDYKLVSEHLKNAFRLERNQDGRPQQYCTSTGAINFLCSVLEIAKNKPITDSVKILLVELFRSLRNYVINSEVTEDLINRDTFLNDVKYVMANLQELNLDNVLKIVLQFLINMVISNENAAHKIFNIFSASILTVLKEKNSLIYESSALLYNISLYLKLDNLVELDFYPAVLELYETTENTEYLQFLLETFLSYENFWTGYSSLFTMKHRILIMEIINQKQIENNRDLNISVKGVKLLANQFSESGKVIFQTVASNEKNMEPYEVSKLLTILSSLSSDERYLNILRDNKNLLISSGVLLINIHRLGKESDNYFSSIQKLAELREPGENICQHPAFGFKANLIRLIGNLCWKNNTMQDLAREAELIPVLLDCCNMDARNPFIIQWVIFAIRNLCENNRKNQEIIAEMRQEGTVSSSTLEEMGLMLHSDRSNSIKIIPLESIQTEKDDKIS